MRIAHCACPPFTTETVLELLADLELGGARVLIQRYGAANPALRAALTARGARVEEMATYRWALPRDVRPLGELLAALGVWRGDAVVFTSAVQIQNLYAVAHRIASGRLTHWRTCSTLA